MPKTHYVDLWQFLMYHWNWATIVVITALAGFGWKLLADD